MLPGILFMVLSAIMFVIAYFLYFKEAYWLISGINTSPRQTVRERYDLPGLTKHMGRMCALIGLIMLVSGFGAFSGLDLLFAVPLGLIFIIVPIFLFGIERYMYVGRKSQRIINIVITVFLTAVAVFTAVMLISGSRAPSIYIEEESLVIKSVYGAEIPLDSVQQIGMADLTGREISKINGFNLGNNLKGRFYVEGLGKIIIFQQGKPCNSILVETEEKTYLINLGTAAENDILRKEIINAVRND